jgi:transposase
MPALCPAAVDVGVEVRVFAGIDSHKDTLAVAVIDTAGRVVTARQVANEPDGFTLLAGLVAELGVVRVGIEGSTNFGWAAAMHLVTAGATVVEVPPLMTFRQRLSRPGQGKSDPVDAVAIARIIARESFPAPVRPMDGLPAELRVLMDYREQLASTSSTGETVSGPSARNRSRCSRRLRLVEAQPAAVRDPCGSGSAPGDRS